MPMGLECKMSAGTVEDAGAKGAYAPVVDIEDGEEKRKRGNGRNCE